MGLAACMVSASQGRPWSSMRFPCATQLDAVWSKRVQKSATKTKSSASRPITARPSVPRASLRNALPPGGTWAKRWRPSQNTSVATAINTPGTPKPAWGP